MPLPRLHLFEFNDLAWVPAPVRDTVVESLSRTLVWGRILAGVVDPLEACLAAAGTRRLLDVGSGAGGPASILIDEFARAGHAPLDCLLTDLHPRPHLWAALAERHPGQIEFVPESIDATHIPEALSAGRVRTIINVLHHLPPPLARDVLLDACRTGDGVFVVEGFERNPLGFVSMWPTGLPALLANPALSPRDRMAKIALTWLTPVAALVGAWDGFVSTMRVYSETELRAMVAPAGEDFEWHYGRYPYLGLGRGYVFWGARRG
ncbi:hypothetical protein L6V77_11035 [Myxococcota bacterium]|nr:hypothetical protein [Myxococcota bacterium]